MKLFEHHTSHPVIIPVIHILDIDQAETEASAMFDDGIRGIFLIDHEDHDDRIGTTRRAVRAVRTRLAVAGHRRSWIGVNLLGVRADTALDIICRWHRSQSIDGLWCDNAEIDERVDDQSRGRTIFNAVCVSPGIDYFGSIALKYQHPVTDLVGAGRAANPFMDVIVTSGPGTGQPCDVAKIAAIRRGAGPAAVIAVASGVTPENAPSMVAAGADVLMVATGIARDGDFHHHDPSKLKALMASVGAR